MQSNTISTDQQLLDRGWAEMSDRLDRDLPIRSKWEAPLYLISSLAILVLAVLSTTHHHDVPTAGITDELTQIETVTLGKGQRSQQQHTTGDNQVAKEALSQVTVNEESSQTNETSSVISKDMPQTAVAKSIKTVATQNNNSQNLSNTQAQTDLQFQNRSVPQQTEIKIRNNKNGIDLAILAQLSIPIKPSQILTDQILNTKTHQVTRSKTRVDEKVSIRSNQESRQAINGLNYLPVRQHIDLLSTSKSPIDLSTEIDLPNQRILIPQLNAGYVYSFLAGHGFNVGFGLNHQMPSVKRLSLFYGLNFTHFQSDGKWSSLSTRELDSAVVFEGGQESSTNIEDYGSLKYTKTTLSSINQLGLTVMAHYRCTPRLILGGGTSLIYQGVTTISQITASNLLVLDSSPLRDEVQLLLQLNGKYSLSPRLSLQPYWKIQPSKSELRTHQMGVDLSVLLGN